MYPTGGRSRTTAAGGSRLAAAAAAALFGAGAAGTAPAGLAAFVGLGQGGVRDLESGLAEVLHVVDDRPVDEGDARRVHQDRESIDLEDLVIGPGLGKDHPELDGT